MKYVLSCIILLILCLVWGLIDDRFSHQNVNYDCIIVVGKTYRVYGHKSDNPFEGQEWHDVYLRDKKEGWVEYVFAEDSIRQDEFVPTFHRTVKDFYKLTIKP